VSPPDVGRPPWNLRWYDWQQVKDFLEKQFHKMDPRPNDDAVRSLALNIWGVLLPALQIEVDKRVRPVQSLATQMAKALGELEGFSGPVWPSLVGDISISDLCDTLAAMNSYVWAGGTIYFGSEEQKGNAPWHMPALKITRLMRDALKAAGQKRGLGVFSETGAANIARELMEASCGLHITPGGFKDGVLAAAAKRPPRR
jgi:hypothetical protein